MAETLLVTGATGFIGLALVKRLAASGLRVRCLVRPGSDASALELPGVELLRGDLLDQSSLEAAVSGVSRVWHLAALVRPSGFIVRKKTILNAFRAMNEEAAGNLAAAAARAGVRRFIHFSSISALGPGEGLRDDSEPAPLTLYGKSKLAGERRLRDTAARAGLDHIILRPAMIYGRGAKGWQPLFDAVRRGRVAVPGRAENKFSICYIENFLDAALLAADRAPSGSSLNVSEGGLSVKEIILTLGAALGKKPRLIGLPAAFLDAVSAAVETGFGLAGLYLPGALGADRSRVREACSSCSHACEGIRALGWRPAVPTAEALAISIGGGQ